jgi:hypothetical protein
MTGPDLPGGTVTVVNPSNSKRVGLINSGSTGGTSLVLLALTGATEEFDLLDGNWYPNGNDTLPKLRAHHLDDYLMLSHATKDGAYVRGISGIGPESPFFGERGYYWTSGDDSETRTPVKAGETFDPLDVTIDISNGQGVWAEWEAGDPTPSTPELLTPSNGAINRSVNGDHFSQFTYDDEEALGYGEYTVHFSINDGASFIPQNDRSRYSILSYTYTLDINLEYGTTYYWFVRKVVDDEDIDSDIWSFTTMDFKPPLPTGITLDSNGNPIGTAMGLNNMVTIRRLVAVADNKVYYET